MVSRCKYFPGCRYRVWNCSIVTTLTSSFPPVMATFAARGLCHLNLNVLFCCTGYNGPVLQFIRLEDWHPAGPTGEGVYLSNALCLTKEPFSQADSCASISQPNVQPPRSWSLTRKKAGSRENHPHALSVGFLTTSLSNELKQHVTKNLHPLCFYILTCSSVCTCAHVGKALDCTKALDKGRKESEKAIQAQLFPLGLLTMATEAFSAVCVT